MATLLRLPGGPEDIAELVDALLAAADHCQHHAPDLATRRRHLADQLGDALDQIPPPTREEQEQ